MEYIFGKNTIDSFLDSNSLIEVYVIDGFSDKKMLAKLQQHRVRVFIKDRGFFNNIAKNANHQGIIGAIKSFQYATLDEILEKAKEKKYPFIVALDGIEDPHNLGAIIRTCEAFSVDGIIIPKHESCPVNSTVAKVSTGALANVKITQVTNLTQTLKELKKKGYWVYVAEAFNSENYEDLKYDSPTVLVVGSEGFGTSRLVKEQADFNIKINMTGKVNSLNVSVATAILVSQITIKHNAY